MIVSFILLFFITLVFYLSISGYGKLIITLFDSNKNLFRDIKILEFFFGLILIGFFSVLFNFFYHLSDYFSYSIILIGLIIYLFFFVNNRFEIKELFSIFLVLLIAVFFLARCSVPVHPQQQKFQVFMMTCQCKSIGRVGTPQKSAGVGGVAANAVIPHGVSGLLRCKGFF